MTDRPKLETLQRAVGGYIETVHFPRFSKHKVVMLANEEGLLDCLPVNENLYPFFIVGDVVFVGVDGENFTGLNDDQLEFVQEWLDNL